MHIHNKPSEFCFLFLFLLILLSSSSSFLMLKVKSLSRVRLSATPWTVAYQAPLSMGFSRQEYWSGLSFPSPGNLPDPRIEFGSPALQTDALLSEPLLFSSSWAEFVFFKIIFCLDIVVSFHFAINAILYLPVIVTINKLAVHIIFNLFNVISLFSTWVLKIFPPVPCFYAVSL